SALLALQPLLHSLSITPTAAPPLHDALPTVTLNAAAPSGGTSIALSSSDSAATVPSTVTVAAGAKTATFTITTSAVTANVTATITASYAGVIKTAGLTIAAPKLDSVRLNQTT